MRTFIVKLVTDERVGTIYKIAMPEIMGKGFQREISMWNGFAHGRRKGATQAEKAVYRDGCCWAPQGLFYCQDWQEDLWIKKNEDQQTRFKEMAERNPGINLDHLDELDERKWPVVEVAGMQAFFNHIGFDRVKRRYVNPAD